jgi:hypothetical protein
MHTEVTTIKALLEVRLFVASVSCSFDRYEVVEVWRMFLVEYCIGYLSTVRNVPVKPRIVAEKY